MLNVNVRREPALIWIGLVAPVVQAITAFWLVNDPHSQGLINTAAVAVAAVVTAILVKAEDLVSLIAGAVQALIALVMAFGLHWSTEQQAVVMVPLGLILSVVVRDRVVAPVPVIPAA